MGRGDRLHRPGRRRERVSLVVLSLVVAVGGLLVNTADISVENLSKAGLTTQFGLAVPRAGTTGAGAPPTYDEVNITLPDGIAPHSVVFDPTAGGLVLTDLTYDRVVVLNTSTGGIVAAAATGADPSGIALDPQHGWLYTVNPDTLNVTTLDSSTLAEISSVALPTSGYAIAADPSLGEAFAALRNYGELAVLSPYRILGYVTVGSDPIDVAVDPAAGHVYALNGGSGTVTVINETTLQVLDTFAVQEQPTGLAIDPFAHLLLVSSAENGSLAGYNLTTGAAVGSVSIGPNLGRVAVCPSYGLAAVASVDGGFVDLVDESSWNIVATYETPLGPFGVAFSGDCSEVGITDTFSEAVTLLANQGATWGILQGTISPASANTSLQIDNTSVLFSSQGAFRANLFAGTYVVTATSPGFQTLQETVSLAAGRTIQLTITLQPLPSGSELLLEILAGGIVAAAIAVVLLFIILRKRRRDRKRYGTFAKDDPVRKALE
jgi:YVTN family beta-propeller protein